MSILFGNLGSRSHNQDNYAVCGLDHHIHDVGRLIAHDVIEHPIRQRTDSWVTVESELRALGAVRFVRWNVDISYDIANQLIYLGEYQHRPMPPKRDLLSDMSETIAQAMCDNDLEPDSYIVEWTMAQLNYGYWQKHNQYAGDCDRAYRDFEFIRRNSNDAVNLLQSEHWESFVSGITCTFDTTKHTFRTQFKHQ